MTSSPSMVDWTLARRTPRPSWSSRGPRSRRTGRWRRSPSCGRRRPGPRRYVTEVTGLRRAGRHRTGAGGRPAAAGSRPTWTRFRQILAPLTDKAAAKTAPSATLAGVGPRVTGVEVGALLSYLAPKVLGQFDPFCPGRTVPGGRLLLVAPNIVAVERELERRSGGLPALGVPARGDPPGAVHRRALAARLPARLIDELVDTAELDTGALAQMVRDAVQRIARGARRPTRSSPSSTSCRPRRSARSWTGSPR